MQEQSDNETHAQNLSVLVAAATLGTEVILKAIGNDHSATTLEESFLSEEDIQSAITARICTHLG